MSSTGPRAAESAPASTTATKCQNASQWTIVRSSPTTRSGAGQRKRSTRCGRSHRELIPTVSANSTVDTAVTMPSSTGGCSGRELIAPNAKIWNSDPVGRMRHSPASHAEPEATIAVASTSHGVLPGSAIPACPATEASSMTTISSDPARACMRTRSPWEMLRP